jgi:hypothetical protein
VFKHSWRLRGSIGHDIGAKNADEKLRTYVETVERCHAV